MKKDKIIEAEIVTDEKPYFFPRLIAYIIDIILIGLVSSLILTVIPTDSKKDTYMKEFELIQKDFLDKKIDVSEYMSRSKDVVYEIDYISTPAVLIEVVLYIGYFIVFQTMNGGQTLGKKLMKIKVVSTKDSKLSFDQVTIRALIIDSIAINVLMVAFILFLAKDYYYYGSLALQALSSLIVIVTLVMIFVRKDGRGLHDIAASTKVVNCK